MIENVTLDSPLQRPKYLPFTGIVTDINDFSVDSRNKGCNKIMRVQNDDGEQIMNFIVTKETYFLYCAKIEVGDAVTGFYNANAPAVLIYPPQYHATVIAPMVPGESVKVDHFDRRLISSDGTLQIKPDDGTEILLTNGQDFTGEIYNRNLIVVYGPTTRSIPAQTSPELVVVMC